MREDIAVYETLRNEIISLEEQKRNVWLAMYAVFVSLFVLGMQWDYHLFLVTYIVIIPFQIIMNNYSWSVTKISTYIRYFIEEQRQDINWESMHVFSDYTSYRKSRTETIIGTVRYTGSSQLAVLATVFFIGNCLLLNRADNNFLNSYINIFWIFTSIILCIITILINQRYLKSNNDELEAVIGRYREFVIKKNSSNTGERNEGIEK